MGLTWFGWYLLIMELLSIIVTVSYIERPRPPLSVPVAIVSICVIFFTIWGIVYVGTIH